MAIALLPKLQGKELIVYGTGAQGAVVIPLLFEDPRYILLGASNSRIRANQKKTYPLGNLPILNIWDWHKIAPNATVLITASEVYHDEIKNLCAAAGYQQVVPIAGKQLSACVQEAFLPERFPHIIKEWYKCCTGTDLDLKDPKTFNEKTQWLKVYDTTPLKTRLADKYLVRDWVAERIGEEHLIPLLGVWERFEDIRFAGLQDQFVLKANHGCGWNWLVEDKKRFDIDAARRDFHSWMETNYAFSQGYELQYMNIPRKIIAEKYIKNNGNALYDYKVHCFGGRAQSIQHIYNRERGGKEAFFDLNWNKLPFSDTAFPTEEADIAPPVCLDLMIACAEKLSAKFSYVRVDFYVLDTGELKFGEMSFTHGSGIHKWFPPEQDLLYGLLLELPNRNETPTPIIV